LAEKLHKQHGVELAFVNSPLLLDSNSNVNTTADTDHAHSTHTTHSTHSSHGASSKLQHEVEDANQNDNQLRTWFHDSKERIGLDASILNIHQIWIQSLHSNPFSGVLGIGQGAAIAALLPLLQVDHPFQEDDDDNKEEDDDEEIGDNGNDDHILFKLEKRKMFHGLQFAMFINGYDLMNCKEQNVDDDDDDDDENKKYIDNKDEKMITTRMGTRNENDNDNQAMNNDDSNNDPSDHIIYHETRYMPSLHIFSSKTKCKSEQLYQHYGGIGHRNSGNGSGKGQDSMAQAHYMEYDDFLIDRRHHTRVCNTIGRFLVQQKKEFALFKRSCELSTGINKKHNDEDMMNCDDDDDNDKNQNKSINLISQIEKTRYELSRLETEAQTLITNTVAENPPKSLMAIITPDMNVNNDSLLVGAWDGDKNAFRSEDFKKSGGAPCPKEFMLKPGER